nr:ATP-binding protein [Rhodococcus sp. (in: high G+C Gram-positive bacteria)]
MAAHAGSAADQLSRFITRFVSAGSAAYLVLLAPQIIEQRSHLAVWYTPVFVGVIFGPALALWFVAFRGSRTRVEVLVTITTVGYLLAQLLWIPAFVGPDLDATASAWISVFPGLMSLATAIVWRPRAVLAYLLVVASLGQVINYVSRTDHGNVPLVSDIVFGVMFCGIFTVTVMLVIRTGRVLDTTRSAAEDQAAATAASHARSVERERFDALIHDDVMSTLLAASRSGNSAALAGQAKETITRLERLRSGSSEAEPLTAGGFEAFVRSALTKIDEKIEVESSAERSTEVAIPMDAVRALTASAAEALRNSVRHAESAPRSVQVRIVDGSATVVVSDEGPGFDQSKIPPHRLGLSVSIRGRMRQLPGGWSGISSTPGNGTTVALGWNASGSEPARSDVAG